MGTFRHLEAAMSHIISQTGLSLALQRLGTPPGAARVPVRSRTPTMLDSPAVTQDVCDEDQQYADRRLRIPTSLLCPHDLAG
jgi:hypothetical protein